MMKLNLLVKKLFVIVALGGFCMPAQAMKQFIGKYIHKRNEPSRKLAFVDYLKQEEFFYMSIGCPEKWPIFKICYEKSGCEVDGVDKKGHTALYYAIKEKDGLAVYELLKMGANINKIMFEDKKPINSSVLKLNKDSVAKKEAEALDLLEGGVFLHWSDSYNNLMPTLLDYSFMQRLALFSKERAIKRSQKYLLYSDDTINTFFNIDCGIITQEIMDQAQGEKKWAALAQLFECLLCSCDIKNIKRFVPLLQENIELKECFERVLEKFKCKEYKEKIQSLFVAEKNKQVMHYILARQKFVDTHVSFK